MGTTEMGLIMRTPDFGAELLIIKKFLHLNIDSVFWVILQDFFFIFGIYKV